MDMLWGEFRGEGGSYVLFSTTREYFLEIKVKKKNCILNIQYSIDRDKKNWRYYRDLCIFCFK